jgi:hypothetical protein
MGKAHESQKKVAQTKSETNALAWEHRIFDSQVFRC